MFTGYLYYVKLFSTPFVQCRISGVLISEYTFLDDAFSKLFEDMHTL